MFLKMMGVLGVFWAMAALTIASLLLGNRMLDEVNARLPADQRFEALWWHWDKRQRFSHEYKRLGLPRTRLVWQTRISIAMALCLSLMFYLLLCIASERRS